VSDALFIATGVVAIGDWIAVWRRLPRVEYALKPLTLAMLIAATATADLPAIKGWVLAALVFSLVGDIALMISTDRTGGPDRPFLVGLAAFLAAHVCYLAAFVRYGVASLQLIVGLLIVAGSAALTLPRILLHARRIGGAGLAGIVAAYAAVLAAMSVSAVGTTSALTAAGGLLFLASDTIIAWQRFVAPIRNGPVLVIVSYHLAQLGIVLGLIGEPQFIG
jgi:uncharacterized membrane protein YhhN